MFLRQICQFTPEGKWDKITRRINGGNEHELEINVFYSVSMSFINWRIVPINWIRGFHCLFDWNYLAPHNLYTTYYAKMSSLIGISCFQIILIQSVYFELGIYSIFPYSRDINRKKNCALCNLAKVTCHSPPWRSLPHFGTKLSLKSNVRCENELEKLSNI